MAASVLIAEMCIQRRVNSKRYRLGVTAAGGELVSSKRRRLSQFQIDSMERCATRQWGHSLMYSFLTCSVSRFCYLYVSTLWSLKVKYKTTHIVRSHSIVRNQLSYQGVCYCYFFILTSAVAFLILCFLLVGRISVCWRSHVKNICYSKIAIRSTEQGSYQDISRLILFFKWGSRF